MKYKEKVEVYRLSRANNVEDEDLPLYGTIEDIRTFMKELWKVDDKMVFITCGFSVEEDFYQYLDTDDHLIKALTDFNLSIELLCEVPIEDFME